MADTEFKDTTDVVWENTGDVTWEKEVVGGLSIPVAMHHYQQAGGL